MDGGPLVDRFGRVVRKLRVSLTDRCNFRCIYCMPEEVEFLPSDELLTFAEIERVVGIVAAMGVGHIRLTGGEPLLRPRVAELVARLVAVPGVQSVSMTTNGVLLPPLAQPLKEAGLHGVNISLDTLDPVRFRAMARRGTLQTVLDGIAAAAAAGLEPVKINTVVMRGVNEDDVPELLRWTYDKPYHVRFIEFMPLDGDNVWERKRVFTKEELLARALEVGPFTPVETDRAAPARLYRFDGGRGVFGVIASVTEPFCHSCDRIRLTADGRVRNCLFALEEHDVRTLLRGGASDGDVAAAIRTAVWDKWRGHLIDMPGFVKPVRSMHAIGG